MHVLIESLFIPNNDRFGTTLDATFSDQFYITIYNLNNYNSNFKKDYYYNSACNVSNGRKIVFLWTFHCIKELTNVPLFKKLQKCSCCIEKKFC